LAIIGPLSLQSARAGEHVSGDWQFSIAPYMWAIAASGDATVEGTKADVDLEFSDIWDALNVAVMVEATVRKNRFGAYVNPLYAQLEWQEPRLDATLDMAVVELGGFYRLGPWHLDSQGGASAPVLVTDLYAGGRYTYLNVKLKGRKRLEGFSADGDRDWVDPIVGLRTLWYLSRRWTLSATGDIGGFGVGSDITWQARGLVGYNFNLWGEDNASVFGGYRGLSWDYAEGSGGNKFEWDVTFHGPLFGLQVRF
jgi:hypothetical protein